ncbi:hypothetical protein [uncultured Shewanella sp.]|uniref:hypothetical protein n=1 Tax=uncultured Shewanella sp. TaxID=173975 RepID=UPI00262E5998|nr:hypothetical protein [uncultured Shewanella sp.]
MPLVCVGGAKVSIPMPPGYSLLEKQEDTLPATKQTLFGCMDNVLIQADLEAWAKNYLSAYEKIGYNQGKLGDGTVVVAKLAQKTFSKSAVVTMETTVTLQLKVLTPGPAKSPNTPPDTMPPPPINVTFTDAGQALLFSL